MATGNRCGSPASALPRCAGAITGISEDPVRWLWRSPPDAERCVHHQRPSSARVTKYARKNYRQTPPRRPRSLPGGRHRGDHGHPQLSCLSSASGAALKVPFDEDVPPKLARACLACMIYRSSTYSP
jgi:hypothetical protein